MPLNEQPSESLSLLPWVGYTQLPGVIAFHNSGGDDPARRSTAPAPGGEGPQYSIDRIVATHLFGTPGRRHPSLLAFGYLS